MAGSRGTAKKKVSKKDTRPKKPARQGKSPGGAPKLVIDYKIVEAMAKVGCTRDDIAEELGISKRTLDRDETFCRVYKKAYGSLRTSLRRAQVKKAIGDKKKQGDTVMLIWLGKQLLDQKDTPPPSGIGPRKAFRFVRKE